MSAKVTSYQKGIDAEEAAADYLRAQGFEILQERYKTKFGEIDIIASKGKLLIFCEVKAHSESSASLYAVTMRSRRRIEKSALWFLSEYSNYNDFDMRFDVAVFNHGGKCVEYLDNAWEVGA